MSLLLLFVEACSGSDGPPPPADSWPPPIVQTLELSNAGWDVPPGEERTMCWFEDVDAPGGGLAIVRFSAEMAEHSHHFNMAWLPRNPGIELPRGLGDCQFGEYVPIYLAGSQWQEVETDLPEGTAMWLPDGAILILQAHFVNATDEPIPGRVDVRMDAVASDLVENWIGVYFNQMQGIEVAAGATETLRARCPAQEDTNVWLLTSHMHHFGERFEISVYDEVAGTADLAYASDDWAHPAILDVRDDPIRIGPNQGFEWSCRYTNPGPEVLVGGASAEENEMCIMAAFYWPDTGQFQYCSTLPE